MRGAEQEGSSDRSAGGRRDGACTASSLQGGHSLPKGTAAHRHCCSPCSVKAARCSGCNRSWGSPVGVAALLLPVNGPVLKLQVFLSNVFGHCIEWKSVLGFHAFVVCVCGWFCACKLCTCVWSCSRGTGDPTPRELLLCLQTQLLRRDVLQFFRSWCRCCLQLVASSQESPLMWPVLPGWGFDRCLWQVLKFLWWPVGFRCQAVAGGALGQQPLCPPSSLVGTLLVSQKHGRNPAGLRPKRFEILWPKLLKCSLKALPRFVGERLFLFSYRDKDSCWCY